MTLTGISSHVLSSAFHQGLCFQRQMCPLLLQEALAREISITDLVRRRTVTTRSIKEGRDSVCSQVCLMV